MSTVKETGSLIPTLDASNLAYQFEWMKVHHPDVNEIFDIITGLEDISGSSYHPDTFKLIEKPGLENLEPVKYRVNDINRVSLVGVKIIHSDESKE